MPNNIKTDRTIRRETSAMHRGRPINIELHAGYLALWPKGTSQKTMVPYDAVYDLGLKMESRDAASKRKK